MSLDVGTGTLRRFSLVACLCILPALPLGFADDGTPLAGLTLAEALERLRAEGLNILYSSDLIRPDMRVLSEPEPAVSRARLDAILAPHGLATETGPGDLLVIAVVPPRGEIRGSVHDARTAQLLPRVRVTVSGTGIVVESDRKGRFRLERVPVGSHAVEAELVGYAPLRMERVVVTADGATGIRLDMTRQPGLEETVLVSAWDQWPRHFGPTPSEMLNQASIERTPRVADDVMRVLEPLPGVVGRDETSVLNVRGGDDDEALVLLDGLELYDPFHLKDYGGFISIIDSRTVESAGFYSDAFPAEYGGRMSAVIDIDSLEPDDEGRTTIGVGSRDAHALNTGGYRGGRGQWLVSARGGFPSESEVLEHHAIDSTLDPTYFDSFGKTTYRLGPKTTIGLRYLSAGNRVKGVGLDDTGGAEPLRSTSIDTYVWLGINQTWAPHVLSRTSVSLGDLDQDRDGVELGAAVIDERSTELFGIKQDWVFEGGRHSVKWGFDFKKLRAFYGYQSAKPDPSSAAGTALRTSTQSPSGTEIGLFVSDRVRLHSSLDLELGLRWDRQGYVESGNDYASPRVHLTFRPDERSAVRLGWGLFYQPQRINRLQVEDGVEQFFRAQRADHLSIGFEHRFDDRIRLRFAAYRKIMTDLHPRFENLFNPLRAFPEIAADRVRIDSERAEVHGTELLVRTDPDRGLGWWAGYTLSSAVDEIGGYEIARSWDQRHAIDLGLSYRTRAWLAAAALHYHSGRPTTPVAGSATPLSDGSVAISPVVGPRNGARLPSYARVDLRIGRMFEVRDTDVELYLNATNVTDKNNACCIESFDFGMQPDGSVAVTPRKIAPQSRELDFGMRWTF